MERILAVQSAINPCRNGRKYVKYLLTGAIRRSGRLGGNAEILAAIFGAI
jgi:hypothetical protein